MRGLRERLHEIIFEADTPAGRLFDVVLLWAILLSVGAVMLESVASIRAAYGPVLRAVEWGFTVLFTIEYVLRLVAVRRPASYALSFYGIVDLLAVAPTYIGLFVTGAHSLIVVRTLRLLRVFRVLKMARYVGEARELRRALALSRPKITVFLTAVLATVTIVGTLMYLIEGETRGFTSIPLSLYWAVVTMTTVGYGDIAPQTPLGQVLSALLMIAGYGIIAVPTGIVTAEFARARREIGTQSCPACAAEGHDPDAVHCKFCGARL